MGKSCEITPTINVGGRLEDSKLFSDLLSFTGNRETAKYIWGLTRVPEFNIIYKDIERDENREPKIGALIKELDLKKVLEGKVTLSIEKRELGATDSNDNVIIHRFAQDLYQKVIKYNMDHPDLVANVHKEDGGYSISLEYKSHANSTIPNQLIFLNELNNQLLGIVRRLGFDVLVDDKLQYDGIFDPTNAEHTAEGLLTIIRIAKGKEGEKAFPEEFSHMMIAGLHKNNLVIRALAQLKDENVLKRVLGDSYSVYYNKYKGDMEILAQEAAAKLLYQYITGPRNLKPNLISRIWNWILNKFNGLPENIIQEAINRAGYYLSDLSDKILDDSIMTEVDTEAITKATTMYKATGKLEEMASKALELASKRLKILLTRRRSREYTEEEILSIKNLQELIERKKYAKSCLAFLKDSLELIRELEKDLNDSTSRDKTNLLNVISVATILRLIKEFHDGYKPILILMKSMEAMNQRGEFDNNGKKGLDDKDAEDISALATKIDSIIDDLNLRYRKLRYDVVYTFLKPYWGEDKKVTMGDHKGLEITLEGILTIASKDINGIDRWISSMSDASDPLLTLIAKAVKLAKITRNEYLLEADRIIRQAEVELNKAGYTSEFMYERDKNGIPTGKIISDYDFEKYDLEKKKYIEYLKSKKYNSYLMRTKIEHWEAQHTQEVVVYRRGDVYKKEKLPIYKKNTLETLNAALRKYYDTVMKEKARFDSMIPDKASSLYNAVLIRNDAFSSFKNSSKNPKDLWKLAVSNTKDHFLRREDDTGFEESLNLLLDFAGKPVKKVPIYYVTPLEDMSRLSTDFSSSLSAYAGMAINYEEISKIVNVLELAKDLAKDREVLQYSGDKKLKEVFHVIGRTFNKNYSKKGSESNTVERLEDYYDTVIYDRLKKDEGTWGKMDKAKTGDSFKEYTGVLGLGLNLFSGISNVTVGLILHFIEAAGGENFGFKDVAVAMKAYFAMLPEYLAEINSKKKTSKLALLIDEFDALEEYFEEMKRQGKLSGNMARILGKANVFFLNTMGEHYLHCIPMLAMLNHMKVLVNGKKISLLDAYERKKVTDDKGNVVSAYLELPESMTKLDGSLYTEEDEFKLKMKIHRVNQSMNGAFADEDKGAIHRRAMGRLIMQFRQWMPAHYNRRFAGAYYDALMEEWRLGYYRTFGKFVWDTIKDLGRFRFQLATRYKSLTEAEKANMRRALAELHVYAGLKALIAMMGPAKDRKGLWGDRMVLYNLKRMALEVGASTPTPTAIKNFLTIMLSPAAAIRTVNNIMDLFNFNNMFVEVESGRYKGMSKYIRDLIDLMPIYPQVAKVADIDTEDYMFSIFN